MNSLKLFFIACLLCFYSGVGAKERVIERPPFIAWSSDVMEIDNVILNDTASIFYVKAFFQPKYWLKIHSNSYLLGDNGEKYMLRSAKGIIPDTEFIIPETGEREFALIFPQLPDSISIVSFFEGNEDGESWKIWGIQLKGKQPKPDIPEQVLNQKNDKLIELPEPVLKTGVALLKGKVLDFMPGMDKKLIFYTSSAIGENLKEIELELEDDGSFNKEIQVTSVTPAIIQIFNTPINLFLAPGEETNLYINIREICRSESRLRKKEKSYGKRVYYDKYLAELSTELEKYPVNTSVVADYYDFFEEIENKSIGEVRDILMSNYRKIIAQIDALKISNPAKQVWRNMTDNSAVYHICSASMLVKQAYAVSNKLSDEEIAEYFAIPMPEPPGFYDVLKQFPALNNSHALYAANYASVFNIPHFDKIYGKATGLTSGLCFDLFAFNKTIWSLEDSIPLSEKQKMKLQALSSPVYFELANQKNEKLLSTIKEKNEEKGYSIHSISDINNEELFSFLLSGFKGKIVLVDFWATWCGPCIAANNMMKSMKDEIKDKDIVYLYLTGENSPESKWENMKSKMPGQHFRLNNEQWEYLCNELNVSGIPSYIIIDRKGEIMYQNVGFPGVSTIKQELEKLLAKD